MPEQERSLESSRSRVGPSESLNPGEDSEHGGDSFVASQGDRTNALSIFRNPMGDGQGHSNDERLTGTDHGTSSTAAANDDALANRPELQHPRSTIQAVDGSSQLNDRSQGLDLESVGPHSLVALYSRTEIEVFRGGRRVAVITDESLIIGRLRTLHQASAAHRATGTAAENSNGSVMSSIHRGGPQPSDTRSDAGDFATGAAPPGSQSSTRPNSPS